VECAARVAVALASVPFSAAAPGHAHDRLPWKLGVWSVAWQCTYNGAVGKRGCGSQHYAGCSVWGRCTLYWLRAVCKQETKPDEIRSQHRVMWRRWGHHVDKSRLPAPHEDDAGHHKYTRGVLGQYIRTGLEDPPPDREPPSNDMQPADDPDLAKYRGRGMPCWSERGAP
jgi:hypothetical protein